ncbi:MAG: biotin transporter BioY [Clostridiaceae bacterium]|jgi:biotin transport system substrate-specific component|nr:biotin transporter BioY [Clostridiaceae bacterium]
MFETGKEIKDGARKSVAAQDGACADSRTVHNENYTEADNTLADARHGGAYSNNTFVDAQHGSVYADSRSEEGVTAGGSSSIYAEASTEEDLFDDGSSFGVYAEALAVTEGAGVKRSGSRSRSLTKNLALTALFTALIIAGTFIKFQLFMIPLTMQPVFVTLAGYLLGKKYGTLSVAVYVLMGLIGIPVFTAGGGFQYVVHPTFGYLLGFILCAFLTGLISEKLEKAGDSVPKRYIKLLIAGFVGMLASYVVGLPYFFVIARFYLKSAALTNQVIFMSGFVNTIGKDIVLTVLAAVLVYRLRPLVARYMG